MDLPRRTGLSPPELGVLDETKRSGDVNHVFARFAGSALTTRLCAVRPHGVGKAGEGLDGTTGEDS